MAKQSKKRSSKKIAKKPANRTITANDLYSLQLIKGSQISPGGSQVLYGLQTVHQKTEKKYTKLWKVATNGGKPIQLTKGKHNDSQARWSPDGKHIAFVSNKKSEKQPQICVMELKSGNTETITSLQGNIDSLTWSPDGKKILFRFRQKDQEAIDRITDKTKKELGIVVRHYTRVFFKMDGEGYLPTNRWGISVVNVAAKKVRHLCQSPKYDFQSPAWSPDGKKIAYVSNQSNDPDFQPDHTDLFVMTAKGKKHKKIDTPIGRKSHLSWSPDGKKIAYIGQDGASDWWKNNNLWVVPSNGKKAAKNLTEAHDFNVDTYTVNDTIGVPEITPPTWSNSGKFLFFQVARHGSVHIYATDVQTLKAQKVFNGKGVIGSFSFNQDQTLLAVIQGTMDDPNQIVIKDVEANPTVLTTLNRKWLDKIQLGSIEEVWFKGAADNDVQGWIVKPPNFDPTKQYPSILEIHGGPWLQYGEAFTHEFQYLAAQGYVVYFCNPRGGQGYGEAHAKAIWNDWGGADYDDLMRWADYMEQQPYIDKNRMGVTGGSYGGYMTNWIIGHTHRFKAACTQRCVSNLISMWGSSDFNWAFQQAFGNKAPFESIEDLWRMSPIRYFKNVVTPTLVIHSEKDYRCDREQGEQVYVALKKLGIDSELLLFPDESHGLSRMGRTDRRIARLEHILRWFDKYLK